MKTKKKKKKQEKKKKKNDDADDGAGGAGGGDPSTWKKNLGHHGTRISIFHGNPSAPASPRLRFTRACN